MATTVLKNSAKGCLRCLSQQWKITTRGKHDTRRTISKVWNVRVLESITRPIFFQDEVEASLKCKKLEKLNVVEEVDEYEEFIFKHCKKMFQDNQMLLVLHLLSTTPGDMRKFRNILINNGMRLEIYNNKLMTRAVTELSQYENMKPWFAGSNVYITSPEPLVKEAIKLLKKMPDFILLGGLVENQLLSKEGLEKYSKLPNIELLRGELVSILNMAAGGRTHSLLESHQQTLCRNLAQYVKQKSEDENS